MALEFRNKTCVYVCIEMRVSVRAGHERAAAHQQAAAHLQNGLCDCQGMLWAQPRATRARCTLHHHLQQLQDQVKTFLVSL